MSSDTDYSVRRPGEQHEVTGLTPVARQDDATKRRKGTSANGKRRARRPLRRPTAAVPVATQEVRTSPPPDANGQEHSVDCLA
jgi:hypothetical protein